jgi:hypothetical protein
MAHRLAAVAVLLLLAASVPVGSLAAAPRSKGITPACGAIGTLLAVGLLGDAHRKHQGVEIAKVRAGWPKLMTAAQASARGLPRSTPFQRQFAERFSALVDRLDAAGAALTALDDARFWAALDHAQADVRAVSALAKRAGLVCRTSDGRGSVTVGP